ncbi:MAG: hypothetical protein L0G87_05860, partial [Renibacterium salmoninarum]|nr:hypothetical protein [Renibacterium salmoninarum]
MPEQSIPRLTEEFGGNEWLVDELYEKYRQDKNSVDEKWWPLFASIDAENSAGSAADGGNGKHAAPAAGSEPRPVTRPLPVVPQA